MRNHKTYFLLLSILFSLFVGCDELPEHEKFKRPDWLPGKLFTTVSVQENLTMFTECLRLTGLDTIIDVSGSWSVFAPTNEAMKQYLLENSYASISAIPLDELKKITKFHIIQFPWSLEQLKNLGINGWKAVDDGNSNPYAYNLFLELVYWYYPNFEPNLIATFNQPEARHGGMVDTLWDLNYAALAFDLHKERFDIVNQTLVRHNGLIAPTDDSFSKFIDGILTIKSWFPHWPDYKSLPNDVVDLIVAQNFISSPIYPSKSQYQKIFKLAGRFHQNEEDIIRKDFGSNCTFIGIDSYIPDRVFTSLTGPVFCRPGFSIFRRAMAYAGVLDVIANHKGKLYFFPIPDNWVQRGYYCDQHSYSIG